MLDIVIAWTLYIILKRVNKEVALLAILFRVVYAAISSTALFNFLNISQLLNDNARLEVMEPNQIGIEVMTFIDGFNNAGTIGLVFFGVHLILLDYLIFKSGFIPKMLGILLLLAGLAYFIDNAAWILTSYESDLLAILSIIVFTLAILAELTFAVWLVAKGKNLAERYSNYAKNA